MDFSEIATKVVAGVIVLGMGNSFVAFLLIQMGRHQLDKLNKLTVVRENRISTNIAGLKKETISAQERGEVSNQEIGYLVSLEKAVNELKILININALLFLFALIVYAYGSWTEATEIQGASTFLFIFGLAMQFFYYFKKHKSKIVDLLLATDLEDKTQNYIRQLSK